MHGLLETVISRNLTSRWHTLAAFMVIVVMHSGCTFKTVPVLKGTVPMRSQVLYDAFGGQITIETNDKVMYTGELIGIRNDSVVVLGQNLTLVEVDNIAKATVVTYEPHNLRPGFILMIPSLLLFVHTSDYGEGALILGSILAGITAATVGAAVATEGNSKNYRELAEGWDEIIKYSRFPAGIPRGIALATLEARTLPKAK